MSEDLCTCGIDAYAVDARGEYTTVGCPTHDKGTVIRMGSEAEERRPDPSEEDAVEKSANAEDVISTALLGSTDPGFWARTFLERFDEDEVGHDIDESDLVGWFSSAFQAKETALREDNDEDDAPDDGPDEITRLRGEARGRPHRFSTEELHELAFQIGGVASLPLLKSSGEVMPAEEVAREVNVILESLDLPTLEDGPSKLDARALKRTSRIVDEDDEPPLEGESIEAHLAGGGRITININLGGDR